MLRGIQASVLIALLLGGPAWWYGWTSVYSVLEDVDKLRPSSALCKEFESLMLANANTVQTQVVGIRQLGNDLRSIEAEIKNIDRELVKSQEMIANVLSKLRADHTGQVLVGKNVVRDRESVERDLKAATRNHRRMEARKADLLATAERKRGEIEALDRSIEDGRELLSEMKVKLDGYKSSLNRPANAFDRRTIEGELLAAEDRVNQIDTELKRRSMVANACSSQEDSGWEYWMSGSKASDHWLVEAESIAGVNVSSNLQPSQMNSNSNR